MQSAIWEILYVDIRRSFTEGTAMKHKQSCIQSEAVVGLLFFKKMFVYFDFQTSNGEMIFNYQKWKDSKPG